MICSLIGSFLLVYVAVITFMNILGYPLEDFMLQHQKMISIKKAYMISFVFQLLGMFILLEEGHITTLPISPFIVKSICILFAIIFSYITLKNFHSQCVEKKYFMFPLFSLITLCFWLTLFHS